jgi:pseudouridylate synthase
MTNLPSRAQHLHLSPEVRQALDEGRPVVALESTVISHGLPYPTNLETASRLEAIVRAEGAVPATIAVLGGRLRVGVSGEELAFLATGKGIRKASTRDLPVVVARGEDGATTVAATATIAAWAGIEVFATGGMGGVHREPAYDVSNDLPTLAATPIALVCAGAKSVLDLRATLEWLETAGVPVVGYGTAEFPAFYSRHSGLAVDIRVETAGEVAAIVRARNELGLQVATLIVVPIPVEYEVPRETLDGAVAAALAAARAQGVEGSATTPFLLKWVAEQTGGASLEANVALLENNAAVAAQIARALAGLRPEGAPG